MAIPQDTVHSAWQDTLPPPPGPNTARVLATVTSVDSCSTNFILGIKIQNVLGYGASTPPLAPNQLMQINADAFKQSTDSIVPQTKLIMVLQYHETIKGLASATEWTLVEISNPQNHANQPK